MISRNIETMSARKSVERGLPTQHDAAQVRPETPGDPTVSIKPSSDINTLFE
jgi:hypothetical protein